ncbi:hypothetical protein DID88_002834 [Monilinia fructigena]|uniref:Uncharacterized protein n=1 Tax=Monilinia fructigena TaxID=38457 RepID=A0A395INQ2_9HELO|nr:hypothetical protein DID88_002834 [Monilinia fructigena]
MIKNHDNYWVATAVVILQTSDHSINPKTSNEVTLDTPVTSLIVDKEEIYLHDANPPYHTGGELDAKPDNTRMLVAPDLMRHYFPGGRKEEKEVDLCNDSTPHCTSCPSRETSAVSEDKEEVKSKKVDDLYHAIPLRQVDSEAKPEQDSYGASIASSISSNGSAMHFTPATSSADDDEPNNIEESLIGLPIDNLPLRINRNFPSIQRNTRTPPSHLIKPQSSTMRTYPRLLVKLTALQPSHAHLPPAPPNTKSSSTISPPKRFRVPVPEVRLWIASWFLGRNISFGIPWHGTDPRMRQYIECISWSGDDVHGAWSRSLELDLRG